jgi:outer membrane immunogenic protein
MKKLLLGSVATGALVAAGSASAADLTLRPSYKAPPAVAPVPVFSWTGCYVGGHGGWGWGRKEVHEAVTASGSGNRANTSSTADTSGSIFGGQIGCDYQFSGSWVIGIEGSLSGTHMDGVSSDPIDPHDSGDILRFRTDALGSVTARLGFAGWVPQSLLYVRGGVAWARDVFDFQHADNNRGIFNQTRTGWTIGVGIEYAFLPNWSVFGEYDHYDFGTKNVAFYTSGDFVSRIDVKQDIDVIKFGVNYRFNVSAIGKAPLWAGKSPVVARY